MQQDNIFAPMRKLSSNQQSAQAEPTENTLLLSSMTAEYDADAEMQLSSVTSNADVGFRTQAASIVIEWIKSGETDYESLEAMVVGFINDDEDSELSDDEKDDIDELMQAVGQFIADHSKLTAEQVEYLFEEEDDNLAIDAADDIEAYLKGKNTDEFIADYAAKQNLLLSAVNKTRKAIRDGKVVTIKKRTKKYRMTPARRLAIKAMHKKSNTAAARAKRKKSNRLRNSLGMNK